LCILKKGVGSQKNILGLTLLQIFSRNIARAEIATNIKMART
jgi:hypothetical protein